MLLSRVFRFFVLSLFIVLFGGCQEEVKNNDTKDVSRNANPQEEDDSLETEGNTDNEDSGDDDGDGNKKRRKNPIQRGVVSPVNESNARLYIHNYLALLKTATRLKPTDLAQKYKVAGKVDNGKFLHAFPDERNEQLMLDIGFPIVREELDSSSTYINKKAHERWKALPEPKKSAIGHLFLESLIRELKEMNSNDKVHN